MDIKAKIDEVVAKVKSDKGFAQKFSSDPIKAIESIIGIDLPDDMIKPLIDGVKAKLSGGKAKGKAESPLDSLKKLF